MISSMVRLTWHDSPSLHGHRSVRDRAPQLQLGTHRSQDDKDCDDGVACRGSTGCQIHYEDDEQHHHGQHPHADGDTPQDLAQAPCQCTLWSCPKQDEETVFGMAP